MTQRGFSLIELIVVIAIIATLLAIATLQFNQYTTKSTIEKEVRAMYADLMKARSEALMQKVNRSVVFTASQYSIFPTTDGSGTAIEIGALQVPVTFPATFSFDSRGLACEIGASPTEQGTPWAQGTERLICVVPSGNPAAIDGILITTTSIQMGKLNGSCTSANFSAK